MERQFVSACAGARMSYDEICKVIGAGRNEDGKPIAKTTLIRNFKNELANGRAMLRSRVIGRFYQALDDGEPCAVQMGLRNQFGWDRGRGGFSIDLPAEDGEPKRLEIEFVTPTRREIDYPVDMTPPAKPDYSLPALEAPKEQPFRRPGSHKPGDWMK
jgi:hypothetical protein